MGKIFISYRRNDAEAWAALLRDRLASAFGQEEVFRDDDTLAPGPWPAQISHALERCQIMLVVIGRGWVSAENERGPRLLQADDVHRREIEMGLRRPEITVIPVLVDGVSMPRREDLPESIQALTERQARPLAAAHRRRQGDLRILVSEISRITGLTPRRPVTGLRWVALGVQVLIITIGATVAFLTAAFVIGGWTFPVESVSVIALAIFAVAMAFAVRRARARRALDHADE